MVYIDSCGNSQEPYLARNWLTLETLIKFLRIGEAGMIEVMTNAGCNKGGQLSLGKEPLL